jgi:hypothetical protein
MRNKFFLAGTFLLAGMSVFFCTCKKASTLPRVIQQKLACDVAQYSLNMGGYPTPNIATLFQKTYDAEGKAVTEIECVFFEPHAFLDGPSSYGPQHDLLVYKNDSSLILRDKSNMTDTAMIVLFNKEGRPASSITSSVGNLTDSHTHFADTETFVYKGGRIFSVKTVDFQEEVDTVRFDSLGNLLSFAGNTYIYDYYRQATESFYMMDYQPRIHGYYLLQYLGYFPEVTNTTNIRSALSNSSLFEAVNLAQEQYDSEGRVIGFDTYAIVGSSFGGYPWITTVTYHCP